MSDFSSSSTTASRFFTYVYVFYGCVKISVECLERAWDDVVIRQTGAGYMCAFVYLFLLVLFQHSDLLRYAALERLEISQPSAHSVSRLDPAAVSILCRHFQIFVQANVLVFVVFFSLGYVLPLVPLVEPRVRVLDLLLTLFELVDLLLLVHDDDLQQRVDRLIIEVIEMMQ
jgi:hypothetical protein